MEIVSFGFENLCENESLVFPAMNDEIYRTRTSSFLVKENRFNTSQNESPHQKLNAWEGSLLLSTAAVNHRHDNEKRSPVKDT
jgi:hypothetical protein